MSDILNKYKNPNLDKDINAVAFTFVNPTSNPVPINIFDQNFIVPQSPTLVQSQSSSIINIPFAGIFYGSCYDEINNYLFLGSDNEVRIYDATNYLFIQSIPIGIARCIKIIYDSFYKKIYCLIDSGNFLAYDCLANVSLGLFTTGACTNPTDMVISTFTNTSYVCGNNNLVFISNLTQAITFTMPLLVNINLLAYSPVQKTVYCRRAASIQVYGYDEIATTFGFLLNVAGSTTTVFCYSESNDKIYLSYSATTQLQVIDCATNTAFVFIPIAGIDFANCTNGLFADNFNSIYINSKDGTGSRFFILNVATSSVTSNFNTETIIAGSQLAYGRDGSFNEFVYSTTALNSRLIREKSPAVQPYVVSYENVSSWNIGILNLQKLILRIAFYSQNQQELYQPINIGYHDAAGLRDDKYITPINRICTNQFQPNIAYVDFDYRGEFLLDGLTFIRNYTLAPNSLISLVVYYVEYDKAKILKGKSINSNCFDVCCNEDPTTMNWKTFEAYLKNNACSVNTYLVKKNMENIVKFDSYGNRL